jgi:hypothetical protein
MSDAPVCFTHHGDWTGDHRRTPSCPEPFWFINECGDVYDYDITRQTVEFPNDYHVPYKTKAEAEAAAIALDEAAGGGTVEQMSYEDAISYAIFAINTFTEPGASSDGDVDRMLANTDRIIATLVDLRETVQDQGTRPVLPVLHGEVPETGPITEEILRRLAEGE